MKTWKKKPEKLYSSLGLCCGTSLLRGGATASNARWIKYRLPANSTAAPSFTAAHEIKDCKTAPNVAKPIAKRETNKRTKCE